MSRSPKTAVVEVIRSLQDRFPKLQWSARVEQVVLETLVKNGDLGFTCFGGPAVHFQVVRTLHMSHERFLVD